MSKALKELKNMICDEIEEIAEKGELTPGSLGTVDQLTHSLKSIETILAMEEGGYSNDAYPRYYTDHRYDRRYSRDSKKMVERLRDMLDEASTEKDRTAIRECINKMEG